VRTVIGFVIGFFVGSLFGMVSMCLCIAAGEADEREKCTEKDN
jgi:hypothetical protein